MAPIKKPSAHGRAQDWKLVARGQKHEVSYEVKQTGPSAADIKNAVKSDGNSRKAVEQKLPK